VNVSDSCMAFDYNGNFGIGNRNPIDNGGGTTFNICISDVSVIGEGALIVAKNIGGGNQRKIRIALDSSFYLSIGDYGSGNDNLGTWITSFRVFWNTPSSCLYTNNNGNVYSGTGNFIGSSDERRKTDIETIDNALWKVEQLRGVNYTDIQTNERRTGLIAQEVELIIPEVVYTSDIDGYKAISYGNMVGVLVNAIKELKQEIRDLKKNNNLI